MILQVILSFIVNTPPVSTMVDVGDKITYDSDHTMGLFNNLFKTSP
jgi:hypothetical protein